jgi:hypothetical protein
MPFIPSPILLPRCMSPNHVCDWFASPIIVLHVRKSTEAHRQLNMSADHSRSNCVDVDMRRGSIYGNRDPIRAFLHIRSISPG